eukprot:Skav232457  [mRNA]  locus=scaffold75:61559:69022:- [translate_table: standard]
MQSSARTGLHRGYPNFQKGAKGLKEYFAESIQGAFQKTGVKAEAVDRVYMQAACASGGLACAEAVLQHPRMPRTPQLGLTVNMGGDDRTSAAKLGQHPARGTASPFQWATRYCQMHQFNMAQPCSTTFSLQDAAPQHIPSQQALSLCLNSDQPLCGASSRT